MPVRKHNNEFKFFGEVSAADFDLPELRTDAVRLELSECHFTDLDTCVLPEMTNLQHLELDGGNLTADLFRNLHLSKRLSSMRLNYWHVNQLGDDFMVQLCRCSSLEHLRFCKSKVTDKGMLELVNLPNLQRLEIGNRNVTDAAANSLAKCNALERLEILYSNLTDEGVRQFASLPNLTELWLSGCAVSPAIGQTLTKFESLEKVILYDVVVDSASAKAFASMSSLKKLLVLADCWTIEDLETVTESNSLMELALDMPIEEDDHMWTRLDRSELLKIRKNASLEEKLSSLPFEFLAGPINSREDFLKHHHGG